MTLERLNRENLRRIIFEDGRSLRKIVQQAGLSYNCGQKLVNSNQRFITPATVDALSRVLHVDREELVL